MNQSLKTAMLFVLLFVVSSSLFAQDKKTCLYITVSDSTGTTWAWEDSLIIPFVMDRYDVDVALAGRVYCNVDATDAGIEPGDLLTTSSTPGHAMKVDNFELARGAILGKAMQKLDKGRKGRILVLVTLQ